MSKILTRGSGPLSEQSRDREGAAPATEGSPTAAASLAHAGTRAAVSGSRAYFITFSCYGTWLHGDEFGSVDPEHNLYGTPVIKPDPMLVQEERARMDQPPYQMDGPRRDVVLRAVREVCTLRGWFLHAAHVRSAHVHTVVQAGDPPEKVMGDFKSYASRRLNEGGFDRECPDLENGREAWRRTKRQDQRQHRKRWTRHGSTRYLWNEEQLHRAIEYVLYQQGPAMAVFYQNRYQSPDRNGPSDPPPLPHGRGSV